MRREGGLDERRGTRKARLQQQGRPSPSQPRAFSRPRAGCKSFWSCRLKREQGKAMSSRGGIVKADSTLRCSQAVPHPSTNRALGSLTSEVGRDPVYSTRYGRQRIRSFRKSECTSFEWAAYFSRAGELSARGRKKETRQQSTENKFCKKEAATANPKTRNAK